MRSTTPAKILTRRDIAVAVFTAISLAAAAAAYITVAEMYIKTSLSRSLERICLRARLRTRLSAGELAEYDALTAENDAESARLHYDVERRDAEDRAKYAPSMFPGAPTRLEEFTVAGLMSALDHAVDQRDATREVPHQHYDPAMFTRWDGQVEALESEIYRRGRWEYAQHLSPLDKARIDHARHRRWRTRTAPSAPVPPPPDTAAKPQPSMSTPSPGRTVFLPEALDNALRSDSSAVAPADGDFLDPGHPLFSSLRDLQTWLHLFDPEQTPRPPAYTPPTT
ncbi:hypothetical protein ACQP2U_42420 (plasmid) [Nocardia sp. CA-084685]|uniref:hypothetical protein n=1 Tax=Nocardia sp. CA-084685 TaxID=3239970 RepID=UPI003D98AD5A